MSINYTEPRKGEIRNSLESFIQTKAGGSANKASKLTGVSGSYISQIRNGKWEKVADKTWEKLEGHLGLLGTSSEELVFLEDENYKKIRKFVYDSKETNLSFGIVGNPGWGKSVSIRQLIKDADIFKIECHKHLKERDLLGKLLTAIGEKPKYRNNDRLDQLITAVKDKMGKIVFIMDEAHRLNIDCVNMVITLINMLEWKASFVMIGTDKFESKTNDSIHRDEVGAEELKSRLGGLFIHLEMPTAKDLSSIARVNGIDDEVLIKEMVDEVIDEFGGDKRRLKRLIISYRKEQLKQVA